MYTTPIKAIEPLPDLPRKSNLRTVCLRAGKIFETVSEVCIPSPPKKRDVHALNPSPTKRVRFDVDFSDDVGVCEFETSRAFKVNTARWRKADAAKRNALRSGVWKKKNGLFQHVASDTTLLESGFLAVVLQDMPWPPVQSGGLATGLRTPSPPAARASSLSPGSPPAAAVACNPCKRS